MAYYHVHGWQPQMPGMVSTPVIKANLGNSAEHVKGDNLSVDMITVLGQPAVQLGYNLLNIPNFCWADEADPVPEMSPEQLNLWKAANDLFCQKLDLMDRVFEDTIPSSLKEAVADLIADMYVCSEEAWNQDLEILEAQYGKTTVDDAFNAYHRKRWVGKYDNVVKSITYQTKEDEEDEETRRKRQKKLEKQQRMEAAQKAAPRYYAKFRNVNICKHGMRCEVEGCHFVHPKDRDYKKALYNRCDRIVFQGLETSGDEICRNGEECIAHKYGLCIYAHNEQEHREADEDNVSASVKKRAQMAGKLVDLLALIEKEDRQFRAWRVEAPKPVEKKKVTYEKVTSKNMFAAFADD